MNVKDKLLARLLCKLIQILPAVVGHWPDFPGEELNIPKSLLVSELDPVAKFTLGPFENLNDEFYKSSQYVKAVKARNKEVQEKLIKYKEESFLKRGKTEKVAQFQKRYNGNSIRFNTKKEISVENQLLIEEKMLENEEPSSKSLKDIQEKLKEIKKDMGELQKLTGALWKIKEDLKNFNSDLCDKLLRNLLQILNTRSRESSKERNWSEIPNEHRSPGENGFKLMNNITYNNQYQIGNIFIFNRLSEKKKSSISNFNERKEEEDEIFYKSTESNTKALSGKGMNNLEDEPKSEADYGNLSEAAATPQSPRTLADLALIRKLQANFSKILFSGNVTLEHIDRMSKIVDFVERYHGILNDSKYVEDFKEAEDSLDVNYEGEEKKNEKTDSFTGERANRKAT